MSAPPLGPATTSRPASGRCEASAILPVRNNAGTIATALTSVLAATDIVLDVLVLDDASTDHTARQIDAALAAAPAHPHAVRVWTGQPHRGLAGNGVLTAAAATDLCIAQHGDDLSEPHRFRRLVDLFAATGADTISSDFRLFENDGPPEARDYEGAEGFITAGEIVARGPGPTMVGAALAWRRRVFTDFPPLDHERLFLGHDTLVPFRGALRGGFYHTREPLLRHRVHAGQWSHRLGDSSSTGAAIENQIFRTLAILRAMSLDCEHLQAGGTADPAPLERLRTEIAVRQTELLDFFIRHRESLLRVGQRVLWVDAAEFDRIQISHFHRRFWRRGHWRRLRAWWRRRR